MPAPTEYRFLSAAMPPPSAKVQYVSAADAASMRRRSEGILDPYRFVVQCVTDRQPGARRFVEQARRLGS